MLAGRSDYTTRLFRPPRPDFIETTWRRRTTPSAQIVPVSKTGLHGDSVRPVSRTILLSDRLLRRRGGEISPGDHASDFLCDYRLLIGSGRGCGALCSLRHCSIPSLGLAGLRPAHARDAASPLHGRCWHGFLCQAAVTIRGASAIPAHHVQKSSPSHLHRPAGDVLRGGAVSREPRTHPH